MLGTRLRCGSSRASSVARGSMRNRGAFGKEILALHCRVLHYADCGATAWPSVSPRRGRAIDAFAPTMRADRRYQPDRSLAPNTRSLRLMKRHARTLPLFITMVAMLAFAAPGYGALTKPTVTAPTNGASYNTLPHFSWNPVSGADLSAAAAAELVGRRRRTEVPADGRHRPRAGVGAERLPGRHVGDVVLAVRPACQRHLLLGRAADRCRGPRRRPVADLALHLELADGHEPERDRPRSQLAGLR